MWIGELFIKYRSNLILGGKGEGAAGIFEAWDMNNDRKITVDEVFKKINIELLYYC